MTNKEFVSITEENGKISKAEVLFTYEANGDQYVFYVIDEMVYAARVKNPEEETEWILEKVLDDEWKLLEKVFEEWSEENNKE